MTIKSVVLNRDILNQESALKSGPLQSAEASLTSSVSSVIDKAQEIAYLQETNPYRIHELIRDKANVSTIKNFLDKAENRNCLLYRGADGKTPLILAIERGSEALVRCFLATEEGKNSVTIKDGKGKTPLMLAIERKHDVLVKGLLLMEKGRESIALKDVNGKDALCYAATYYGDAEIEVLNALIDTAEGKKALCSLNKDGESDFLTEIIGYEKLQFLQRILAVSGEELLSQFEGGNFDANPLFTAIGGFKGRPKQWALIRELLESPGGKRLLSLKDEEGNTPLHIAAMLVTSADCIFPLLLDYDASQSVRFLKNDYGFDVEEAYFLQSSGRTIEGKFSRSSDALRQSIVSNPVTKMRFAKLYCGQVEGNTMSADHYIFSDYLLRMLSLDEASEIHEILNRCIEVVHAVKILYPGDSVVIPKAGEEIVYKPYISGHALYIKVSTDLEGIHQMTIIDRGPVGVLGSLTLQGLSSIHICNMINYCNACSGARGLGDVLMRYIKRNIFRGEEIIEKIIAKRDDPIKSVYKDEDLIVLPQKPQSTGNCTVKSLLALIYHECAQKFKEEKWPSIRR